MSEKWSQAYGANPSTKLLPTDILNIARTASPPTAGLFGTLFNLKNAIFIANNGDDVNGNGSYASPFLTLAGMYASPNIVPNPSSSNRYICFDIRGIASESVKPEINPFIDVYGCGTEISFPAGLNLGFGNWTTQDADATIDGYVINEPTQLLLSLAFNQNFNYNLTFQNLKCINADFRILGFPLALISSKIPNVNFINCTKFDSSSTFNLTFLDGQNINLTNTIVSNLTQLISSTPDITQTLNAFGSEPTDSLILTASLSTTARQLLSRWSSSPASTFTSNVTINNFQGTAYNIDFSQDASNWTQSPTVTSSGNYRHLFSENGMPVTSNINTTTYTLVISDEQYFQVCNNAATQTITVPTNASVAFPINTEIAFFQQGAGQVVFAAAGGVTIQSISGNLKISAQYGAATLKKIATDTWSLFGSLSS